MTRYVSLPRKDISLQQVETIEFRGDKSKLPVKLKELRLVFEDDEKFERWARHVAELYLETKRPRDDK